MDKKDLSSIVEAVQKSFKNDKRAKKIGLGSSLKAIDPDDCIKMPKFWTEATGTPGLPFGRMVLIAGTTDSGKCLGYNTPVLMHNGTIKKVQDIKVGDKLMGPDSQPRTVVALGRGRETMYKIIPNFGYLSWTCNENHILSLKRYNKAGTTDFVNLTVKEFLKLPKFQQAYYKLYRASVEFEERPVEYDPYWVGLWIGDGTKAKLQITTDEPELDEYFEEFCKQNNLVYKKVRYLAAASNRCSSYSFTTVRGQSNPIFTFIRTKLIKNGEKTIPENYLINSRKNRLLLLAGLLDSGGYLNATGRSCYEIIQKNKELAEQIAFLASSLGFRVSISEKRGTIKSNGFSGKYFRIVISGHTNEIPCRLKRKKAGVFKGNRDPRYTGFKIEKIGEGDYYGFTLKENPLFCLADLTVTHNTSLAIQAMKAAQEQNVMVIYVETEGKTTPQDLEAWGVDPTQIILIQTAIAEDAFETLFRTWDALLNKYPNTKLLVIVDSIGNVISQRDADLDLSDGKAKPGGHGQVNRMALNKIIAKMEEDQAALLLISYTYDNIGAPGKRSAGGEAMHLFSSLHYQTSRAGWIENSKKERLGAKVLWKLQKNHINKSNPGPKNIMFHITKDGMEYKPVKDD